MGATVADVPVNGGVAASVDSESTPERLLDAAERLIGERGIELVSLRSINAAAGSNVAAAHYHFGSKEALVTAVLERRMGVLAEHRMRLLAPLEHLRQPPIRAVVEALVVPLAELDASEDGGSYVRFLAMLDRAADPWWRLVSDAFAPQWARMEPLVGRALPQLPDDVLRFRLSVAGTVLLGLLAEPERHPMGPTSGLAGAGFVPAVVDVVSGVLTGPPARSKRVP
jgi:AcrR family transcriptional regulator